MAPEPGDLVLLVADPRPGIRMLTMNRPEARNALDRRLRDALRYELRRADVDPAVRVIVLTGAGGAFSAGVDLKEALGDGGILDETSPGEVLRSLSTPTIAAVDGACYTGALDILLSCSFAVASEKATFADTHAVVGLIAGWGISVLLPRVIGSAAALRMMLTGRPIAADEALRLGLLTEVTDAAELLDRALDLAEAVVRAQPAAVSTTIDLVRNGIDMDTGSALAAESVAAREWRVDSLDIARRMRAPRAHLLSHESDGYN